MKYSIIMFLLMSNILVSQDLKVFYPEFDSELLRLWLQQDNNEVLSVSAAKLNTMWTPIRASLELNLDTKAQDYICRIEEGLIQLEVEADRNRYDLVKWSAWNLLTEFRNIRTEFTSYPYPLDYLLHTYGCASEIEYTVNDLMFGLMYWFEFKDILNEVECYWLIYKDIPDKNLLYYNPQLNLADHIDYSRKFEECKARFLESLESDYQSDYVVPCDEMNVALLDLISLYSSKNNNKSMVW